MVLYKRARIFLRNCKQGVKSEKTSGVSGRFREKRGKISKKDIDKKRFVYYNGATNIKRKVLTMRKFLAALLAVFMLTATIAVLPVAAADELADYEKSLKDGTTIADAEALGLVVTEYMSNTTSSLDSSSSDAFQYIEVYNRGNTDVNLYDLAIVRGSNATSGSTWNKKQMFEAKLSIQAGSIYTGSPASNTTYACDNPMTAIVKPGQFAIIWFWNSACETVSKNFGKSIGASSKDADGKVTYHNYFRQHYRTQNAEAKDYITDDLLIVAVYAGSSKDSTNMPTFSLNTSSSYMYALVDKSFDYKNEKVYERFYGANKEVSHSKFNSKIVCMWQWRAAYGGYEGAATIYAPADASPDFYNATQKAIESSYVNKHNYYEAGFVDGFKEVGQISSSENNKPTIGSMTAFQWAYVDPANAPESVKALAKDGKTWQQVALEAYVAANVEVGEQVEDNAEIDKNQSNIHVDRDNLGNKDQNVLVGDYEYYTEGGKYYRYPAGDKSKAEEINKETYDAAIASADGLGIWLWVIIGGAAAVVLAGAAVVVIIILKKKNKPVAADDVAAEGEVAVIDEEATAEKTEE